ncbi:MAG: hypothetical protein ACJAZP_001362 [Psychromonas sp.]|jgi:hypothetical protein|uniref:hypothetical protein n=1 Tax=Psychromonas sp. TaxID=1884585 RepID=UPI0039E59A0B
MKFLSAFINHCLQPAKRAAEFSSSQIETSTAAVQSELRYPLTDTPEHVNDEPQQKLQQLNSTRGAGKLETGFTALDKPQAAADPVNSIKKDLLEKLLPGNAEEINNRQNQINATTDKPLTQKKNGGDLLLDNKTDAKPALSSLSGPVVTNSLDQRGSVTHEDVSTLNENADLKPQHTAQRIQAEPVFNIAQQLIENHPPVNSTIGNETSRPSPLLAAHAAAEEIPQVRIGQVNVVIDDRSAKVKHSPVQSPAKSPNSFGLRGL